MSGAHPPTAIYEESVKREYLSTYQYRRDPFAQDRVSYVEALTPIRLHGAKVLDIGCGLVYFLDLLMEVGADAKGLDLVDF